MLREQPNDRLWVVLDEEGVPAHVSINSAMAHDHINDALDKGLKEAGQWVVREYMRVLSRQEVEKLANGAEGVDALQWINSLLRTIEGQRQHIALMSRRIEEYRDAD